MMRFCSNADSRVRLFLGSTALADIGCTVAASGRAPAHADVLALNRVSYGISSVTLAEYQRRGPTTFLDGAAALDLKLV